MFVHSAQEAGWVPGAGGNAQIKIDTSVANFGSGKVAYFWSGDDTALDSYVGSGAVINPVQKSFEIYLYPINNTSVSALLDKLNGVVGGSPITVTWMGVELG
jgi:hypothetical protein